MPLRPDSHATPFDSADAIMQNVPESAQQFIITPKVRIVMCACLFVCVCVCVRVCVCVVHAERA